VPITSANIKKGGEKDFVLHRDRRSGNELVTINDFRNLGKDAKKSKMKISRRIKSWDS